MVRSSDVALLDHKYVYGDVPPVAVKLAAPVDPALQDTSVPEILALSAAGSVIVTEAVAVQLLSSVTVTV